MGTSPPTRTSQLRTALEQKGASLVGFADVSALGLEMAEKVPFGICFALRHDDLAVEKLPSDEPWLEMSSRLRDKARALYRTAESLLDAWGYRHKRTTSGIPPDDLPDLREMLPQKTLGTLSGLGWIGRSSLLVSPRMGPRIRICAILTDMPLLVNSPFTEDQCKDCTACVDACPVGAITGSPWSHSLDRRELLDVSKCQEYLWSTPTSLGRRQTCGVCLKVCPVGRS